MSKLGRMIWTTAAMAFGAGAGALAEGLAKERELDKCEERYQKMACFYKLLVQWLMLKQDGRNLAEYFVYNGYHTVAIYGMKELGQRLEEELEGTDVAVAYLVDKNTDQISSDHPALSPDDVLPQADVMVVTAVYYYQEIEEAMREKVSFPILSLEDVVYGLA